MKREKNNIFKKLSDFVKKEDSHKCQCTQAVKAKNFYEIRKLFKVEYSHQLSSCFSTACSDSIHGHSGKIEVIFRSEELNKDRMVIDFGEVKSLIGEYIDSFDHALIMPNTMDEKYLSVLSAFNKKMKIVDYNPTAEAMAKDIYDTIKEKISCVHKVIFHETDTGWASYEE